MSIRRISVFLFFVAILIFLVPWTFSKKQSVPKTIPIGTVIQVDTPFGIVHVDRFAGDVLLLPYLDVYSRIAKISYTREVLGMPEHQTSREIKSPLGYCILIDKLRRGKHVAEEQDGWYRFNGAHSTTQIKIDSVRLLDENTLTGVTEYLKAFTSVEKFELTAETLRTKVQEKAGCIILLGGYYPLYVYMSDENTFYAMDPIRDTDTATILFVSDSEFEYRGGLLLYTEGVILQCLDE